MHGLPMLTESRKRRYSCDAEEVLTLPQAKRLPDHPIFPEISHVVWESESSSSYSSGISSPERLTGAGSINQSTERKGKCFLHHLADTALCLCSTDDSYHHINLILKEAHFSSLKTRGHLGPN